MEIIGIIASWAVCLALIGYGLMAIFAAEMSSASHTRVGLMPLVLLASGILGILAMVLS